MNVSQDYHRADEEEKLVDEEKQLTIQLYDAQLQAMEVAEARTLQQLQEIEALLRNIDDLTRESFSCFHADDVQSTMPDAASIERDSPSLPSCWTAATAAADGRREWAPETPPGA